MDMIYWDHYYSMLLVYKLIIVIALFASLRLFSGAIAHINASEELLKKDNPAFGISLAGATFAVAIMLTGTIYSDPENGEFDPLVAVGVFGVIGICLMTVTRVIFDKITLPAIHLRQEITAGNIAVAIADAGNVIATAIILRAVMIWVPISSPSGIVALGCAFAASQALLTGMTILRVKMFGRVYQGGCLQEQLRHNNIALALRFAGNKIGTAFAIATAAQIVIYEDYDLPMLGAWMIASILVIIIWKILYMVAEQLILFRVDTDDEVIAQKNIALGALQAAIAISLGFLISIL